MVPAFDGGDDFFRVCGPDEGFWRFVCLLDEVLDGGHQLDEGFEDAALQPLAGKLGEVAFDGVEPRAGRRSEVEHEALMPGEPGNDSRVLVGCVVVENYMDLLSGGDGSFQLVEKADELLVWCCHVNSMRTQ